MITTSLDVLYISLAIGFFLIAVFVSVALVYLILILRDAVKISDKAKDTMNTIHEYVLKPVAFMHSVAQYVLPILEKIRDRWEEKEQKEAKKK